MKEAYILGAGGFAKEVHLLIKRNKQYNFQGFIVFNSSEDSIKRGNQLLPLIDEDFFLKKNHSIKDIVIFIGMGDPLTIKKVSEKFKDFTFPNLISPCVEIDESVTFGVGNIITKGVNFTVDINVGSFNIFNLNMTIGHDTVIGNYNVMNPGATISGNVTIGDGNLLGTGSTILQNLSISNNNIIGGNGLLSKNVLNDKVMIGVPCKELIKAGN
jgi:sugar O-acyltransferase (sialic acid O-acetyltransferase NeuD family)